MLPDLGQSLEIPKKPRLPSTLRISWVVSVLAFVFVLGAIPSQARLLLVLPLEIDSTQVPDYQAYRRLFQDALAAHFPGKVVPAGRHAETCFDLECAGKLARAAKASHLVFGSVRDMGSAVFFKATIAEANGKAAFSGLVSLSHPDEIQSAAWNLAESLVKRKPAKAPARGWKAGLFRSQPAPETIETTRPAPSAQEAPSESQQSPEPSPAAVSDPLPSEIPRTAERSYYATGVSVGYAPPLGSNYGRWRYLPGCVESLVGCPDSAVQFRKITGLKVGWNHWLDLSEQLTVEAVLLWYAPQALGADLNLTWRFAGDWLTPFAGGGAGYHLVFPDEGLYADPGKRNHGMAWNLQGGLILFESGSMDAVTRLQYHHILNTDGDRGFSADIAIRATPGGRPLRGFGSTTTATWLGVGLGGAFLLNLILGLAN